MRQNQNQKVIVLIEDEKIIAQLLVKKLEASGYIVKTADDGQKGIALVKETNPDMILLDMMLPKVDGFGVLEALRNEHIIPKIPLIIISNSGQQIEVGRALKLGARDYLIKVNFDPQDVAVKVNEIFSSSDEPMEDKKPHVQTSREMNSASISSTNTAKQNDPGMPTPGQVPSVPYAPKPKGSPRVLLIEDDVMLVQLLERKLLQQNKYDVHKASDIPQARITLAQYGADIILLDIVLPGTDGFTFLSELKTNPDWKDIPVIITSNLGQQEEIQRGMDNGAVDYVVKAHTNPQEIIEKIDKILIK
ncbi:MAG: response regulator [Candidatus Sungbacteria bacterium]|nr:response regulator [Candidatus Sungbacteria bacterium]